MAFSRVEGLAPLVVAANRDERLDRPALPVAVLDDGEGPRILGGRDLLAGGTWLAVNEHGVVAGLTNSPAPSGRDPSKRSRGELPLALTRHTSAAAAVEELAHSVRPADFNPAWLLVGDRGSLFLVAITGEEPAVSVLPPGVHILENSPPETPSPKVDHVRALLGPIGPGAGGRPDEEVGGPPQSAAGGSVAARLVAALADHSLPPGVRPESPPSGPGKVRRPAATWAACVHALGYGTRSSLVVEVPAAPRAPARVLAADGPPCTTPFADVSALWQRGAP